MPIKKSPVKKTPVKKTPVKKTPAKKTPAKKTPIKIKAVVKRKPLKTVCLEGYKVTSNGRCIKDKKYKTYVSTVKIPTPPPHPQHPKPAEKISMLQAYLNKKFAGKGPEVVKASTKLRAEYQQNKNDLAQALIDKAAKSAAYRKAWVADHLPSRQSAGDLITF